jgi:hypothetical protein
LVRRPVVWPAWLSGGAPASIGASSAGPVDGGVGDWLKSDGSSGTTAGFGVESGGVVVAVSGVAPVAGASEDAVSLPALPAPEAAADAGVAAGWTAPPPSSRRLISAGDDGSPVGPCPA